MPLDRDTAARIINLFADLVFARLRERPTAEDHARRELARLGVRVTVSQPQTTEAAAR